MIKNTALATGLITGLMISSLGHASSGFKGSFEPIPTNLQQQMKGYTWHKGCPMPLKNLSYVTLSYWGFDHKTHVGHVIVLRSVAADILDIFRQLYAIKFPIDKMQLPSTYQATDDWPSTEDDNTAAFFCRKDDQTTANYSPHSYGIAIDINPVYNPSIVTASKQHGTVQPAKGKTYLNRQLQHQGMITTQVVRIFAEHGWKWGAYFSEGKDYMHFQKDMDSHYSAPVLIYRDTTTNQHHQP